MRLSLDGTSPILTEARAASLPSPVRRIVRSAVRFGGDGDRFGSGALSMRRRSTLVTTIAIAAAYWAAAKLGLSLAFEAEQVSAVWPPSGIALAALFVFGVRAWPGVALGAFVANVTAHEPVATAAGIAVGNTLEAVAGATLLAAFGFRPAIDRVRDALSLLVFSAGASTMLAAAIGVTSLCLGGVKPWTAFPTLFRVWWLGDASGVLVVAPLLLTWPSLRRFARERRRLGEAIALCASLLIVGCFVFLRRIAPDEHPHAQEYLVFPLMIWAAVRFGPPVASPVAVVVSGIALAGTLLGAGPFGGEDLVEKLILLQLFMVVVAITGLVLAASVAERDAAERHRAAGTAVTNVLVQSASVGDAAPRILQTVCEALGWDVGGLWIVDASAGVLRCVTSWHRPSKARPAFESATRRITFAPGVGLPGRVWTSGAPLWIADVVTDPNFPRAPEAARDGLHGAFGFPVLLGSRVLGVIEFFSQDVRAAEPDLLDFMGALGSQLGLLIDRKLAEEERDRLLAREQDARERAENLYREAHEQDRRKDEFLAMLGHELRNPLAPLRNAVHLLGVPGASPASLERAREVMERQIDTLRRLVDDLLDVSRITRGKIQLSIGRVDLVNVVHAAVETVRPMVESQRHALSVSVRDGAMEIDGDATRLEQVLANLLNNAAKYTEPGGRIWIDVARDGDAACVRVRDTGIGIAPELLPRVFEMFTQADRSLARSKGGLGIGLTLVRRLVELHGGTVTAHSDGVGRGSEFLVRLPARSGSPAADRAPADAPASVPSGGTRRRVLVVDDNGDAAETLAAVLRAWGHDACTARDGPSALEVAARFAPDTFLLDIGLPGMDGYELARRLRADERHRAALLVALTGYGQAEDRRLSREAEIDHHLVKPVDLEELARLLHRVEAAAR
jgi:signal transduction histidine kinase/integral membrane sensor domain MASE1/ActR/RegA family two-component response regulator